MIDENKTEIFNKDEIVLYKTLEIYHLKSKFSNDNKLRCKIKKRER